MRLSEELRHRVREDLGLLAPFSRGQDITIRNCWHFSTDGNFSSVLFQDETDFIDGMNRVCIVSMKHKVVILAFVLMDNHLHFILHGDLTECIIFMQDYIRRTSVAFHQRHGVSHIFKGVPVNHQAVTTDRYLKTAICYVFKNPPCAGTRFMGWNYHWGSGGMYFRMDERWSSSKRIQHGSGPGSGPNEYDEASPRSEPAVANSTSDMSKNQRKRYFKTNAAIPDGLALHEGIVLPYEYVAVDIVEELFRSTRSFNYFMCITKEDEIEKKGGYISRLSIPDNELRQCRDELLKERFGKGIRMLGTDERLLLGKLLKRKYNCSTKQISRMVSLAYSQIKDLL